MNNLLLIILYEKRKRWLVDDIMCVYVLMENFNTPDAFKKPIIGLKTLAQISEIKTKQNKCSAVTLDKKKT